MTFFSENIFSKISLYSTVCYSCLVVVFMLEGGVGDTHNVGVASLYSIGVVCLHSIGVVSLYSKQRGILV